MQEFLRHWKPQHPFVSMHSLEFRQLQLQYELEVLQKRMTYKLHKSYQHPQYSLAEY